MSTAWAQIIAVVISGLFAIAVAIVSKNLQVVRRTIGEKNGNGDMMTMQAKMLAWMVEHEADDRWQFRHSADQMTGFQDQLDHPKPLEHDERYHNLMGELALLQSLLILTLPEGELKQSLKRIVAEKGKKSGST